MTYYVGAIFGISVAVIDGLTNVAISFCSEVNSLVLLWWSSVGGVIATIPTLAFDTNTRILSSTITDISLTDWITFCILSMSGLFAYFLYTKSCQLIDPTLVAVLRSTEIIFSFLVQTQIMNQLPNYLEVIGAFLVLISVTLFAIQNFFLIEQEEQKMSQEN